eukprot:TRINITY_DN2074_c0_g2_i1.p3 TRINITY_DN2074_c0_g2~~TRINITY_DN2074_c0_g2_i1.p3  ORF type:complete len:148 (+),score=15.78 TRINITY_DN2074_c0_g2_i1:593-1036(+)
MVAACGCRSCCRIILRSRTPQKIRKQEYDFADDELLQVHHVPGPHGDDVELLEMSRSSGSVPACSTASSPAGDLSTASSASMKRSHMFIPVVTRPNTGAPALALTNSPLGSPRSALPPLGCSDPTASPPKSRSMRRAPGEAGLGIEI